MLLKNEERKLEHAITARTPPHPFSVRTLLEHHSRKKYRKYDGNPCIFIFGISHRGFSIFEKILSASIRIHLPSQSADTENTPEWSEAHHHLGPLAGGTAPATRDIPLSGSPTEGILNHLRFDGTAAIKPVSLQGIRIRMAGGAVAARASTAKAL
jgi:hypothetical protein